MREIEALELELKQTKHNLDSSYSEVSLHRSLACDIFTVLHY